MDYGPAETSPSICPGAPLFHQDMLLVKGRSIGKRSGYLAEGLRVRVNECDLPKLFHFRIRPLTALSGYSGTFWSGLNMRLRSRCTSD